MLPVDSIFIFFSASLALALVPGPDNVFVLTQSALYGRLSGLFVTLGLCTGLIGHTAAVAFGVTAVFQTSELAFDLLKVVGASYLLYLAWQTVKSEGAANIEGATEAALSARKLYFRGVVMNITNPKVALFFLAFLPQFIDPSLGFVMRQTFQYGGLFIVATLIVFGSISWLAGSLGDWLKRSKRTLRTMNYVAGVVFVGLALKLFFDK